jgi:transposase
LQKNFPEKIDWSKIKSLKTVGMDEIALRKGHKDFVVIVSTKIDGKTTLLGVLTDRKKQTVKDFLSSIPKDLAKTIENVCCDMYDGYINAAKEILGSKVKIIIDRFHVAKNYRGAIDSVRKQEMKRLKSELSEEDYKKLKNVMWLLRKKHLELNDEEKETLSLLFNYSPKLKQAYSNFNSLQYKTFQHD